MRLLSLFVVSTIILGCTKSSSSSRQSQVPLLSKLNPQGDGKEAAHIASASTEYLINFTAKDEADAHRQEMVAAGATVRALDSEGRTLLVSANIDRLRQIDVAASALAVGNSTVHLNVHAASAAPDFDALAQEVLTTKSVVGVNELQRRFPQALGEGLKVAVFDTGIDFGVEGLSRDVNGRTRLNHFYDMTSFGKVTPQTLAQDAPQFAYTIGGMALHLQNMTARRITTAGVLSEAQLARDYLAPGGVDLNGNDRGDDSFVYLVGVNEHGQNAVWVDLNQDGVIDGSGADEELTDYNTTHKYLDTQSSAGFAGSRPLAVTISSPTEVQFHSMPEGHGTSCSLIIAGDHYANGRLTGMVPHADLVGFVLDSTGQDIYSLAEFTQMFLKARDVGVNAISLSWGFSTADLSSSRFVADFLDREITSRGIVIGIAAGNEGPGINSAAADDYIPRYGFGVGAMIPQAQAENVYGWVGAPGDTIVWYSSFGPTAGGRQMPDISSPIVTLVRGQRDGASSPFYGFSGTSSATPAFVGATMAMVSALHSQGHTEVNARLLKLALQNSAQPLAGISEVRQGAGVVNVDRAYDIYLRLEAEMQQAVADTTHRSDFAYELTASVPLVDRPGAGEGIHLRQASPASKVVTLSLSASSKALIDNSVFFEPLILEHSQDFFSIPQVANLQFNGATFTVQFDAEKLSVPGSYIDSIKVRRAKDGLVLSTIPVVIEVPLTVSAQNLLGGFNQTLGAYDILRQSIRLERNSSLRLEGMVTDITGSEGNSVGLAIRAPDGHTVGETTLNTPTALTRIEYQSNVLPAGPYEVIIYRNFRRPAVLSDIQVNLVVRPAALQVQAAETLGETVRLGLQSYETLAPTKATLKINALQFSTQLLWNNALPRPAFTGSLDVPMAADVLQIGLRQSAVSRLVRPMLHMEVGGVDRTSDTVAMRAWIDVEDEGMPLRDEGLSVTTQSLNFIAYPNILRPQGINDGETLRLIAQANLETPLSVDVTLPSTTRYVPGQVQILEFNAAGLASLPAHERVAAVLELRSITNTVIATIPVQF